MKLGLLKFKWTFLVFLLFFTCIYSQSSDTVQASQEEPSGIRLNTFVEKSEVPQNRRVVYHIEVSWHGKLSLYQIEPVSLPTLTNLLLEGSGSENRLEPLGEDKYRAVKAITYRFKPLEMGMAYIDGVTIKYTNRKTSEEDQLTSQRVMVEITEPIPEEGGGRIKSFIYVILLIIFFGAIAYFLFKYLRKRSASQKSSLPVQSIPEHYLNRLAQEVDPRGTNLQEMVGRLSKIFREYLSQDFDVHARELNTREIISKLHELAIDETDRQNLIRVFEQLDEVKFAGKNVDPAEFTNIYGTIESFLIKRKQFLESTQAEIKEEQ